MVFGLRLGLPKKAPAEPPSRSELPSTTASAKSGKEGGGGGGGAQGKNALTVNEFVARTKRCRERGLEPTKPELIAYARYLGIDPITDADLMWIADEALNAPLPSEWTEHHDSADRVFYYNVQTHASSWTHPLEQLHRDTYKSIVSFRSGDLSKEDQAIELEKLRRKCEESERDAHKELQAWTEHTDEQGQKFYYNRDQQRSVWTDPRPARCHALYLQMKALRVLSKHCGQSAPTASGRGPEPIQVHLNAASELGRPQHSHRDRDRDELQSNRHLGNQKLGPVSLEGNNDDRKEKKRKKDKRNDADRKEGSHIDELPSPSSPNRGGGGFGNVSSLDDVQVGKLPVGLEPLNKGALELKKPTIAAVEEVRAALGVSVPPLQHTRGPLGENGRLPTPPGDGLSSVGRAKVRAGIRLEPLRGGG